MKIIRNPDKKLAHSIEQAIEENGGYCCCALVKDDSTKCMCDDFRNQVARGEIGECHCGLYRVEE